LLECLRYILVEHSEADAVMVLDALDVSVGKWGEFSEAIHSLDDMAAGIGPTATEDITLADTLSMIQWFAPTVEETITAADALAVNVGIELTDIVNILEDVEGWRQFGFGGGLYGVVGFGGWVVWYNRTPDEVAIFDELMSILLSGPIPETVTAADDLYIHSGFGCPLGTGFGLSPFGK
jgi:hypothetical protein